MSDRIAEIRELKAKLQRLSLEVVRVFELQQAASRLMSRLTAEADQLESQVKDLESSCS